jgi:hypothetical protein
MVQMRRKRGRIARVIAEMESNLAADVGCCIDIDPGSLFHLDEAISYLRIQP